MYVHGTVLSYGFITKSDNSWSMFYAKALINTIIQALYCICTGPFAETTAVYSRVQLLVTLLTAQQQTLIIRDPDNEIRAAFYRDSVMRSGRNSIMKLGKERDKGSILQGQCHDIREEQ